MVPYWPTEIPDSQIRTAVVRTVPARSPCTTASGTLAEANQQTRPTIAIPEAVATRAMTCPPEGWGRISERATSIDPAISSIAVARASERPGGRIASFCVLVGFTLKVWIDNPGVFFRSGGPLERQ